MQWKDKLQCWTWTHQVVFSVFYQPPFRGILKIIKKCGPKAEAKIVCPSIYQEWTPVWSSAVQNITQRPAKNPQHRKLSKLTKVHGLILLLITIIIITAVIDPWKNTVHFAPFFNCLLSEISWAFSSKLTPVERSWVQSSSKAAHPHLSSRRQQSHFTTEVNRSWLMSFI